MWTYSLVPALTRKADQKLQDDRINHSQHFITHLARNCGEQFMGCLEIVVEGPARNTSSSDEIIDNWKIRLFFQQRLGSRFALGEHVFFPGVQSPPLFDGLR
jgi:hypothetical protein